MDNSNERNDKYRYERHDKMFVQVEVYDETATSNSSKPRRSKPHKVTLFSYSCNESKKGIKIELNTEVKSGTQIDLWLSFEGLEHKFYLTGMVRWCDKAKEDEPLYQVGVELKDNEQTDYKKWHELLESFAS